MIVHYFIVIIKILILFFTCFVKKELMNIYINKGSTIFRTITHLNYYDIDWKPATLHFETSLIKPFNVRCSENHPNYNLIISPINYINKIEFQYIFDTGFNGEKYNDKKIVSIISK